jgi:hypothetical protein
MCYRRLNALTYAAAVLFFIFVHMLVLPKSVPLEEVQAVNETLMQIQGGTLVTPYGVKNADMWINQGKISHIRGDKLLTHKNGQQGQTVEVFDAAGYFILPGFISMQNMQVSRFRTVADYLQEICSCIEKGYTTLVDTIRLEEWMEGDQLLYQITPHFNNKIDYAVQIGMDAHQFTPNTLRQLGRRGFQLIQVTVRDVKELDRIDWEAIYPVVHQYKCSLQLLIPSELNLMRAEREAIMDVWLGQCQYGKVRTRVGDVDPFAIAQRERFYHISEAEREWSGKLFAHFIQHWHQNFPVFSPLEQLSIRITEHQNHPEEWLSTLVRLASTNIAKAVGCYPHKGSLQPGADADLLLVDKSALLTNFDLSTILNFSEICQPAFVMSKGKWVLQDGVHSPKVGTGKCLRELRPYSYVI